MVFNSGIKYYGVGKIILKSSLVLWFPKGNKAHLGKFTRKWFGPYKI
jgi:hypothetical protein